VARTDLSSRAFPERVAVAARWASKPSWQRFRRCWDEIGYFQCGDNPGRKEPGTGEINYRNVFKYIHDRSKQEKREIVIGMEHDNSKPGKAGELAVIQAYRDVDVQ